MLPDILVLPNRIQLISARPVADAHIKVRPASLRRGDARRISETAEVLGQVLFFGGGGLCFYELLQEAVGQKQV